MPYNAPRIPTKTPAGRQAAMDNGEQSPLSSGGRLVDDASVKQLGCPRAKHSKPVADLDDVQVETEGFGTIETSV